MIVVGEKINGARKQVGEAVANRDADFIRHLASRRLQNGAFYPDINAASFPRREPENMVWQSRQAFPPPFWGVICGQGRVIGKWSWCRLQGCRGYSGPTRRAAAGHPWTMRVRQAGMAIPAGGPTAKERKP